jgi:hypothetical protein
MKELSKQKLIDRFIVEATAYGEHYLETGHLEYKKGNKLMKKLHNTFLMFSHDLELASEILNVLMDNENDLVRSLAAKNMVYLGLPKEKAMEILHEIAKRDDIWGFDARNALWIYANMSIYKDKQEDGGKNVGGNG